MGGGGVESLSIPTYTAHVEALYQRSICFLHIEQTFVCIPVADCVCLHVGSPDMCVLGLIVMHERVSSYVSVYHPAAPSPLPASIGTSYLHICCSTQESEYNKS